MAVPGEQYWTDGRIRSDADGYAVHYDVIDDCWVNICEFWGFGGGRGRRKSADGAPLTAEFVISCLYVEGAA